jgi:hypothetical protein
MFRQKLVSIGSRFTTLWKRRFHCNSSRHIALETVPDDLTKPLAYEVTYRLLRGLRNAIDS